MQKYRSGHAPTAAIATVRKVQIGTGMGAPGFAAIVAPDLGHPQAVQAIMRQSGQVAPPFARVPLDGVKMAFGVGAGSNIGRAAFLIITYTATIFDKMVIAGASSITARGAIERVGEVHVLWSQWFLAYLPCDIITILIAWRLTLWLYPPEKPALDADAGYLSGEQASLGRWDAQSTRAALLIALAIGLWLTDFLHHVSPAVIGLGVGLATVLPGVGVLTVEDLKRVNYLPVFFVATAVSMGSVLAETKVLDLLTGSVLSWMEPMLGSVLQSTLVLYWTAFVYHFFLASEISMLGTSIPVLMQFAKTHGLDPLLVGMTWTFGAGGKLFAYQSAVLIVGLSYGYFSSRDLLKLGFLLTLVECAVLLLLVFVCHVVSSSCRKSTCPGWPHAGRVQPTPGCSSRAGNPASAGAPGSPP